MSRLAMMSMPLSSAFASTTVSMRTGASISTWREVYETSTEQWIKDIASNQLYRIKATVDTEALSSAVKQFKEKYGRFPADLNQLVRARLIREVPQDLEGHDYLYDPKTGEVKAPRIWWKR
jgi:hypothetical protein